MEDGEHYMPDSVLLGDECGMVAEVWRDSAQFYCDKNWEDAEGYYHDCLVPYWYDFCFVKFISPAKGIYWVNESDLAPLDWQVDQPSQPSFQQGCE